MNFQKIKIKTTINSNVNKTWNCWISPNHIVKWNFASDDWCCPNASVDLRIGGKYLARMEAKDGSFGFNFEAIYQNIIPFKKIVLEMSDGRFATTEFFDHDGKTQVITIFDAEEQNSIEMQKNGWQSILDNFKKYVDDLKN